MQEDGFVTPDGYWSCDGIRLLKEGDDFTIYAENGNVLFQGILRKDTETGLIPRQIFQGGRIVNHPYWKQQAVGGMWVHWLQKDMDPEKWAELFVGNKRCVLKRASED